MTSKHKPKRLNNLSDIAARCGVASMTVSRALRGDSRVAEKTRLKILKAAQDVGYQIKAKHGRPRRASVRVRPCIDVLIGTSTSRKSWYYSSLLVSLEQELGRHQHDCIIRSCDNSYNDFLRVCEILREQQTKHLLVVGYFTADQIDVITDIVPEVLLVDHPGHSSIKNAYETVGFDNVEAARLGVRHLRESGRKKILLIKGFADHYFSREIEQGYAQAMADTGSELDQSYIVEADFTATQAGQVVSECVEAGLEFDGVFTNDEMATGVLQALKSLGKKVPQDVAVCGCDGLPICEQLTPSLTTLHLDYKELARVAVNHFFSEKTERSMLCKIKLVPQLIVRESTTTE
jgi:DNA-binding LacI/PurR family transcriptional regulator